MADFYIPKYGGYSYKDDDEESSSSSGGSRKKVSTGKDGFYTPSYAAYEPSKKEKEDREKKKRLDDLAQAERAQEESKRNERPWYSGIGDFAAASNEALLGGITKGAVTTANWLGSGFNSEEAERKTQDFLKKTKQVNDRGEANLASGPGVDRNSGAFQAGKVTGDVQRGLVDLATLALPGFAAEKAIRATRGVQALEKAGGVKNWLGAGAGVAGGSAASTGIGAAQDIAYGREQDLAKNAAIGTAADLATPIVGKLVTRGAKAVGLDKLISGTADKVKQSTKSGQISSQTALEASGDAERKNAAGILETAENASQGLKTRSNEVVQVVNPSTGEKTFYRIPEGQRDEIVNSIDNDRTGQAIAGQNVDGLVTHVTARSPEDMAKRGFKDGGVYGSEVGTGVEQSAARQPGTPGTGQSRYVSQTLPDSDFVHIETKGKLGANYNKVSNQQQSEQALKLLDAEGVDNFATNTIGKLQGKHITSQGVIDAQAAAQALEKRGGDADFQRASEIYNALSQKLSEAGQTVQAAAILSRQTPQGLNYYAQSQLRKAGVELTPELQKELKQYIDDVANAAPKSEAEAIARDNVQYFIASNIPSSTKDKVINFWRAGLLTSPTTTAGAITGNAAQAAQRNLITDPVSVLADMVLSLGTGKRTVARAEIGSSIKGGIEGAKVLGDKQYLKTGFNRLNPEQKSNKYLETATSRQTNYGDGRIGKAVGTYVNGVYKVMGAADIPFRNAAQAKSLSSLARAEAINQGLKGSEAKKFVDDFVANPPKDALETATKEAEAAVFANDTELGKAATKLANSFGGLGQVLIPFAKVPSAVATKVITSTPIGTASEIVRQIYNVKRKGEKFDQRALSKAIGEGTTGVPIIGAGYALGASGMITGGYPSSQAERDQWEAEGKKPNSIKIGDKWYSLNYVQPFATLLATGAKAREAEQAGLDIGEVVSQAAAGMGQSVLSQSFLQGLSGAIDAVKNPADFAGKFVANTASSVVPNFIRAATTATDPLKRDAQGAVEGFMSGVPGLRQQISPKLDNEGQPITNDASFAEQYLNPLKPTPSKVTEDTELNNQAIMPGKRLREVRIKEINKLLAQTRVQAAQRKIYEYNQQLTEVIAPYINDNLNSLTDDQIEKIEKLYLGEVWINDKGRPSITTRDDLPK